MSANPLSQAAASGKVTYFDHIEAGDYRAARVDRRATATSSGP